MPPKKNKKPSRNGYWEFVLECRDKQPNKNNMSEIQTYASRKWAAMSKEERQPYELRAQLARDNYAPKKMTTDGLDIDEVYRKENETTSRLQNMKTDITRTLKAASFAKTLDEQIFLIIHINHLVHYPNQDKYFICEVAVAALDLKNGVEDVFHAIVKPGELPLGFFGAAFAHSKETHQMVDLVLEEGPNKTVPNNTESVFRNLIVFMKKYNAAILYADEKTFEMTTKVIDNFCQEFNYDEEIKVYNLQYLFFALRNAVAGKNVWPTDSFSHSELEKDLYGYTPNISCEFHESSDVHIYCSKSIVTRYCYTICDHCCADLKIQLVPGFHVPLKSRVTAESRVTSQAASVCSFDSYRSAHGSRGAASFDSTAAYDDNYPPLGGSNKSGAESIVSFSSMKISGKTKAAASRIAQSVSSMSLKETAKRNQRDLQLPEHGPNFN